MVLMLGAFTALMPNLAHAQLSAKEIAEEKAAIVTGRAQTKGAARQEA